MLFLMNLSLFSSFVLWLDFQILYCRFSQAPYSSTSTGLNDDFIPKRIGTFTGSNMSKET